MAAGKAIGLGALGGGASYGVKKALEAATRKGGKIKKKCIENNIIICK